MTVERARRIESTVASAVNELERRRVLWTTQSTCLATLYKSEVWDKIPRASADSLLKIPEFSYNTI